MRFLLAFHFFSYFYKQRLFLEYLVHIFFLWKLVCLSDNSCTIGWASSPSVDGSLACNFGGGLGRSSFGLRCPGLWGGSPMHVCFWSVRLWSLYVIPVVVGGPHNNCFLQIVTLLLVLVSLLLYLWTIFQLFLSNLGWRCRRFKK